MSLTGALLAVFIQQWAQSYLQATQGRNSPRYRARIRTYHAEGLDKWHLHHVTRAVPVLIHASLFLFFSGLPVFLFSVNRTVFNVVVTWLGLCVAGYACITLMPIFCHDSPYFSPLSTWIWFWLINTLFFIYRILKIFMPRNSSIFHWYHTRYAKSHLRWPSAQAMQKSAARFALQLSSDIDYRALLWMFKTLNDDDEFEEFFDALPSLCKSEALVDPQGAFIKRNEKILSHALVGMMDRTLLSDLVSEEVKERRIIICTKAIDATSLLGPWWTLRRVLFGDWHGFSQSVHFGLFVQGWKSISEPVTAYYAQYAVAVTLAGAQVRDDNWFQLASGQLNKSKNVLWGYHAYHGDSILLINAIFIILRTVQTFSGSEGHHRIDIAEASRKTLGLICRFDIQNTLPEHQNQFCNLWNQLVDAAQNNTHPHVTSLCKMILKSIRRLYIALHEDTPSSPTAFSPSTDDEDRILDDARSFPRCELHEHEYSLPVPELQLGELPRSTRTNLASSIDMLPAMSPALIPGPLPPYTPHLSASRSRRASVSGSVYAGIPTPYSAQTPYSSQAPYNGSYNAQTPYSGSYNAQTPYSSSYNAQMPYSGSYNAQIPYSVQTQHRAQTPYSASSTPIPRGRSYSFSGGSLYYPPSTPGPYYPPTPYSQPTPSSHYPVTPGPHYPVTPGSYYPVTPGLQYPGTPGQHYPVTPGSQYPVTAGPPYPVVPGSYSHSAPPAPPGVSPFVPIPQMAPSRRRRRVPATIPEADLRNDIYVPSSPSALSHRSSSPASHVYRAHEPVHPAWEQPDVISPVIHAPVSTRAPGMTTQNIDTSHGISGPTTTNHLERPSPPPAMIIPETLPAPPLPTPASATGSGTAAPVPPVMSSPQERISTPPSSPPVSQEPPVGHQETNTPVKASRQTTRHFVSFDIPSPSSSSAAPVPLSTAPSASSSRAVPFHAHMTRGGIMPSWGGHAPSPPLVTAPVIRFDGYGDYSGLLYYSLHSVLYEDELYPTALHLFEARKFLDHRPDLADRIRQCDHVEQVVSMSAELAEFTRRDWGFVALSTVSEIFLYYTPLFWEENVF